MEIWNLKEGGNGEGKLEERRGEINLSLTPMLGIWGGSR